MSKKKYTRDELSEILKESGKTVICDVITRLMDDGVVDITDINACYTASLKKRLEDKDTIIKEASNCIFNSLFYDSIGKPDSEDVVLEKVRWRYRYDNTNKQNLCETFHYDPETDSIVKPESVVAPRTMKLSELIGLIESWHDDMMDFCIEDVFSWRGSYDKPCCSLSTRQASKVENLKELRKLLRFSFDGYKGGTYTYDMDDEVHFESDYGSYTDGKYIETFVEKNRDSEIVKHIFQHLI